MQFTTCFVVFLAIIGRTSLAKMTIDINEPDGFAELAESAIKILTTCYANQEKAIVLVGAFPGNFIEKLSSHRTFSLIMLDVRRRRELFIEHSAVDDLEEWNKRYRKRTHKIDVVVTVASSYERTRRSLETYFHSPHINPEASVLLIGFSSVNKDTYCNEQFKTFEFLHYRDISNLINVNYLCINRNRRIMIFGINPFVNHAPEPWKLIGYTRRTPQRNSIYYYAREYREHEEICRNLDFDKTQNLGGSPIRTLSDCFKRDGILVCSDEVDKRANTTRLMKLEFARRSSYIYGFITYVNASLLSMWSQRPDLPGTIVLRPVFIRGVRGIHSYAYPHGTDCKYLVSQFRGNKSQLEKIISVIDNYSWIGMLLTYCVSVMFFKFFLRQSLIAGILNLIRLTFNSGLTREPPDVAPRVYLACLLFFVVTMQGIFTGNLASLLTHEIPVRQVDSVEDVTRMGYTVRSNKFDFIYFEDPYFHDHLIETEDIFNRVRAVYYGSLTASLCWGANIRNQASILHFHISDCIATEYITNVIPWKWILEKRLTKLVGITVAAGITVDLSTMVDEERLADIEALGNPDEPEIMTFADLRFAFVIFFIGFVISLVVFILEILIDRFNRRDITTRIIVL